MNPSLRRLTLIFSLSLLGAISPVSSATVGESPLDLEEAMKLCDNRPLQPVEGIWRLPSENMIVAVFAEEERGGEYGPRKYMVTVVDTPDVSLCPGDTVGWLSSAGSVGKYEMQLFTRRGPSTLMRPARLLAELSADEASMRLKAEKWTVKIGTLPFMRSLWRIVKLRHDDPLRDMEPPMLRIYPSHSGHPGGEERVRYL
ncbi:MAG: hypothetical protein HDS82_01180 [Bacteroidales bacterium]|nr:hypothetical protein [Bacteroidales bacterium]